MLFVLFYLLFSLCKKAMRLYWGLVLFTLVAVYPSQLVSKRNLIIGKSPPMSFVLFRNFDSLQLVKRMACLSQLQQFFF